MIIDKFIYFSIITLNLLNNDSETIKTNNNAKILKHFISKTIIEFVDIFVKYFNTSIYPSYFNILSLYTVKIKKWIFHKFVKLIFYLNF